MSKPKIIFFGTSEFAVPSLEKLIEAGYPPVFVVTQPDKPAGRTKEQKPSPVKLKAQALKLEINQPDKLDTEFIRQVAAVKPDVLVVVAYGKLIPARLIKMAQRGALNIHPSMLPKYRGPSPIQTAIKNLDLKTGVTLIQLDAGMDTGPVVAQKQIEILVDDDAVSVSDCLSVFGAQLLVDSLPDYLSGKLKPQAQDDSQATVTEKISRDDGHVDWEQSADQIMGQFKALQPWPGIFGYLGEKRLKLTKIRPYKGDLAGKFKPGELIIGPNNELMVSALDGGIELEQVQLEGKSEMSGTDFIHGLKGGTARLN